MATLTSLAPAEVTALGTCVSVLISVREEAGFQANKCLWSDFKFSTITKKSHECFWSDFKFNMITKKSHEGFSYSLGSVLIC